MRPGGKCAHVPGRAFAAMGEGDGLVSLMERSRANGPYPRRPGHFRLREEAGEYECSPKGLASYAFTFRDAGRDLYAVVALGRDGPEAQAESILNSLEVRAR